jgi:hypothetical protein
MLVDLLVSSSRILLFKLKRPHVYLSIDQKFLRNVTLSRVNVITSPLGRARNVFQEKARVIKDSLLLRIIIRTGDNALKMTANKHILTVRSFASRKEMKGD